MEAQFSLVCENALMWECLLLLTVDLFDFQKESLVLGPESLFLWEWRDLWIANVDLFCFQKMESLSSY